MQINVNGKEISDIVSQAENIVSGNQESEEVDWLDLVTKMMI